MQHRVIRHKGKHVSKEPAASIVRVNLQLSFTLTKAVSSETSVHFNYPRSDVPGSRDLQTFVFGVCCCVSDYLTTLSASQTIASNDRVIDELKRIWKEVAVAYS